MGYGRIWRPGASKDKERVLGNWVTHLWDVSQRAGFSSRRPNGPVADLALPSPRAGSGAPISRSPLSLTGLALLASALLMVFAAGPAAADVRHPAQTLEFGVDGTEASKFNIELKSMAYDQKHNRIYVLTGTSGSGGETGKIYGFDNPAPGVFTPRAGFPVTVPAPYFNPTITVDDSDGPKSGRIYYVGMHSQAQQALHAIEPNGQFVTTSWPVKFPNEPCDSDVDADGNPWVSLQWENRIVKVNAVDGTELASVPVPFRPCKMTIDPNTGDIYLATTDFPPGYYRLTADSDFQTVLGPFSTSNYLGFGSNNVEDFEFDGATNRLYVVRKYFNEALSSYFEFIHVLRPDGQLVEEFAERPWSGNFEEGLTSVAVNEENGEAFVADATAPEVVRVYAAVTVPDVTTGPQQGNDEITGTVDRASAGEVTDCYFEYATDAYFDSHGETYDQQIACEPPAPWDEDRSVSAKVPGLVNETLYHYKLIAGNANGEGAGIDQLLEPHHVDSLRTQPASAITRTTATLNASFTGNTEDTTYYFQWGVESVTENESTPVTLTAPNGATSVSEPITGLIAGRTYMARVIAERGGNESIANTITFSTLPAVKGVDTDPATDVNTTEATLNGSLDPDGIATSFYFEYGKTKGYGHTVPLPPSPVGTTTPGQTPVSTVLTDLEAGATYHFRLVGVNSFGETRGPDEVFTTFQPPAIDSASSRNVTETSAELTGQIDPNGYPTTAYFEYGTTLDYGSIAQVPAEQLENLDGPQPVVVQITGLQGVRYHFRLVAENEWGKTETENQTFDFYPPSGCPNHTVRQQTGSAYLPDCRAYEIVSARRAGGAVVSAFGPPSTYASSPARFAYAAGLNAIPGAGEPINGLEGDLYVASRSATGWTTRYVGLPGNRTLSYSGPRDDTGTVRISSIQTDRAMNRFVLWDRVNAAGLIGPPLGGNEVAYIYDNSGNELGRLPTNFDEVPDSLVDVEDGGWRGTAKTSADFSHYFFSTQHLQFAPDGRLGAPGSVYDNDIQAETVTVVSKTESGDDIPRDTAGPTNEYIKIPAVSTDGTHVLMSTVAAGGRTHLYMAVNNGSGYDHYDISRGEDGLNYGATLQGMTDDGSKVLFVTQEQLTADDTDSVADLYRWEEQGNTVTRISTGTTGSGNADNCGGVGCGVELLNVHTGGSSFFNWVANSDTTHARDSGQAYFLSAEELDGARGVTGKRNLYLTRADGTVQWVATFDGSNLPVRMNVSPDGEHMALLSPARLTSFDNLGYRQMYTYDVDSRQFRCASCQPSGDPPSFDVEASQNGLFMTADGRTFFTTKDALVVRDANGIRDVYEYVDGRPQLISPGIGDNEGTANLIFRPGLVGVSLDGTDVYFSTYLELVPEDENGPFLKFYDARTNGGFLFKKPPAPCIAADECHGLETTPPAQPVIGTGAALGKSGNARPPRKKRSRRNTCHRKKAGKRRASKSSKRRTSKAGKRGTSKACKKRRKAKNRRGSRRG